jgi:hypothetical protein
MWAGTTGVSPTIFRKLGFRFGFYSNEEPRMHVRVTYEKFEAKFWLEPTIEFAHNNGLKSSQLKKALKLIEEHEDEIKAKWQRHFGS